MRKIIALLLLATMFLSSCGENSSEMISKSESLSENLSDGENLSEGENTEISSEESKNEEATSLEITVKFNGDTEVDFTDANACEPVQIAVNQTVNNFKFIRVFYDEKGNPFESGTLYGTELLTPNDAFSTNTYIRPMFSNRGISYTNDKGDTCFSLISYDEKGNLSLVPFENVKIEKAETRIFLPNENSFITETISFDGTPKGIISALVNKGVLPKTIDINFFYIENNVVHIDFNNRFEEFISSVNDTQGIGCIVNSLLSYYGDKGGQRILITVDGVKEIKYKNELFISEIGNEDGADNGKQYALLYFFDVNAIDFYTHPAAFDGTVEGLVSELAEKGNWRNSVKVNSFEIENDKAYIDLDKGFGDMIQGLMSEALVDCVSYTLKSYYNVSRVYLTIEGEPFKSSYA